MIRARALALCVLVAACGTAVHYEPRSAVQAPAVTDHAIRVYPADLEAVRRAGAEPIGTVRARGATGSSDESIAEAAADAAAEHGGTHFYAERLGYGGAGQSAGRFVVLRVPPERWQELPPGLRPRR